MPKKRGLFTRLSQIHVPKESRAFGDSLADILAYQRGRATSSKMAVTDESALRLGAVWQCVDLISELVSTLPVDEYRLGTNRERVSLPSSPLLIDPAGDGTGIEVWLRQLMTSLLMRGNGYGLIQGIGQDGWPTQIESLHPDRIRWYRKANLGPVEVQLDGKDIERWPVGPLWHVPAYVGPGSPVGMSPIRYAAETIGLGLATQQFGAQWFGDGAHPSSVLTSEHEINEAQAAVLKQRIKDVTFNNRDPLVLGAGSKLEAIQVSPDESQFLETIKANADDVARFFFRRPPGEGGSITYANVESRSLDLLTYTLNGWLVRVERAMTRLRPRPRFVKFNADALVRVDLRTRYDAHDTAIRGGWRSVNEVRRLEDDPSIGADGDQYLWPPYAVTLPSSPVPAAPPAPTGGTS